jgi:reactive intermediate/imine deaminase
MRLLISIAFLFLVVLPVHAKDTQASLPFSKALRVGNMLYLSGELGVKPGTLMLVPGGIGPETQQTMDNIKATLEANGSDMDHVVKCFVMLADMKEWGAMNAVYRTYFNKRFPARSAMGANGLALGARVEIECMAEVAGD